MAAALGLTYRREHLCINGFWLLSAVLY
jgi:hypothetical protein